VPHSSTHARLPPFFSPNASPPLPRRLSPKPHHWNSAFLPKRSLLLPVKCFHAGSSAALVFGNLLAANWSSCILPFFSLPEPWNVRCYFLFSPFHSKMSMKPFFPSFFHRIRGTLPSACQSFAIKQTQLFRDRIARDLFSLFGQDAAAQSFFSELFSATSEN